MTKYVLEIMSYEGLVPGACHYKGLVKGPHPQSCHGGTIFNAPESPGKWTCEDGHEMPKQVQWQVEDNWSTERQERYTAAHFEGAGPSQFMSEHELVRAAIQRFLGEWPTLEWDHQIPPREPGDTLYLHWTDEFAENVSADGYGHALAVYQPVPADSASK